MHPDNIPSAPPTVEVLDERQRVVALVPIADAARQKLRRRTIAVLLFDERGRVHLRRRSDGPVLKTPRWDTTARGAVLAGESIQDAAVRILEQEHGIRSERLRHVFELAASPENGNEFQQIFTLVRTEAHPSGTSDQESDDYWFGPEELDCLLREFRELVSPRFMLLAEAMSVRGLWRRRI